MGLELGQQMVGAPLADRNASSLGRLFEKHAGTNYSGMASLRWKLFSPRSNKLRHTKTNAGGPTVAAPSEPAPPKRRLEEEPHQVASCPRAEQGQRQTMHRFLIPIERNSDGTQHPNTKRRHRHTTQLRQGRNMGAVPPENISELFLRPEKSNLNHVNY